MLDFSRRMDKVPGSCTCGPGQYSSIEIAAFEVELVSILIIYKEAQLGFHSCVIDLKMLFGFIDSPNGIRTIKLGNSIGSKAYFGSKNCSVLKFPFYAFASVCSSFCFISPFPRRQLPKNS